MIVAHAAALLALLHVVTAAPDNSQLRRTFAEARTHRALNRARLQDALASVAAESPKLQNKRASSRRRALQNVGGEAGGDTNDDVFALAQCWQYEAGATPFGELTELHPCFNEHCALRKSSDECLATMFDFCCDEALDECAPSSDMLALREVASCEAQSCSSFMGMDDGGSKDRGNFDPEACPFSNGSVCTASCASNLWDIADAYLWGSCEWNRNCIRNRVWAYDPAGARRLSAPWRARALQGVDQGGNVGGGGDYTSDEEPTCDDVGTSVSTLLANAAEAELTDCLGDMANIDCGTVQMCMPKIFELVDGETLGFDDSNPLIGCLHVLASNGAEWLVGAWPQGSAAPTAAQATFLVNAYNAVGKCTDDGGDGGDSGNGGGNGGFSDEDWEYDAVCEQVAAGNETTMGCASGCCALHDGLVANGVSAFPTDPSEAGYKCAQLLVAGGSEDDARKCMRAECGACYPAGGGLYGPPSREEQPVYEDPQSSNCVGAIFDHCSSSEGSADEACAQSCPFSRCDPRKAGACPCEDAGCAAYYAVPFADARRCRPVYAAATQAFLEAGFFFPESQWYREDLRSGGVQLTEPPANFSMPAAVLDLAAELNCSLAAEIEQCVGVTVDFCNSPEGMWSSGCRQLSACGDGRVSWGEACDDGNTNAYNDGCFECSHVGQDWYCPEPGVPCETCIRDASLAMGARPTRPGGRRYETGAGGESTQEACPFCMNTRLPESAPVSPCFTTECRVVSDYPSAVACDVKAAEFCGALVAAGLHDPGCASWQNKSLNYAVPQIPRCGVSVRELGVHGQQLKRIKYAIIECPVTDPTGEGRETTPMTPYWSPLHGLSSTALAGVDAANRTLLELLALAEKDALVPLTTLTDHETDPFDDVQLHDESGRAFAEHENPFRGRIARLSLAEPQYDTGDQCDMPQGEAELWMLPPCDDPMMALARMAVKQFKWRGALQNDWSFQDFADLSLAGLDAKFSCAAKPGVVQFAVELSRTRLEWRNGREADFEQPQYDCSRYQAANSGQWPAWEDYAAECDTLEGAVLSGRAAVSFGDRLLQRGCQDKDCEQAIAKCARVPVLPESPRASPGQFADKSAALLESILALDDVDSWGEVRQRLLEVSSLAESAPLAAALGIFRSVTVSGTLTKLIRDVRDYCPHDMWIYNATAGRYAQSEDWTADPCCNWELRAYMCCPVQDVPGASVRTVTGFDESKLDVCRNPDMVRQTFANLFTTMARAQKQAEALAAKADPTEFERVWEFEDECRGLIQGKPEDEVNSQADCFCRFSVFDAQAERCETPAADMPRCFAECFRAKYEEENPYVLHFLKEQWGLAVPASNDTVAEQLRFADEWRARMTEDGCEGPESYGPEIGYAGMQWTCNATCQAAHTCSYHDALNRHVEALNAGRPYDEQVQAWELQNDADKCAAVNGTHVCAHALASAEESCSYWRCEVAAVREAGDIPCDAAESCRETCQAPCQQEAACAATNGTWMADNRACCPAGAFVHEDNGYAQCRKTAPGKPQSWELRDELCCRAEGGSWRRGDMGSGECCLADWKLYEWDGNSWWGCEDWVDTYAPCRECEQATCEPLRDACESCYEGQSGCCAEEYTAQNQTACLAIERCNDATVQQGGTCEGAEPFCAHEWGWPASEPARCAVGLWNMDGGNTEANCLSLNYTWAAQQWGGFECVKPLPGGGAATAADCFDASLCPVPAWGAQFPGWEAPAHGNWVDAECEAGCFVPEDDASVDETYNYSWGGAGCRLGVDIGGGDVRYFGATWRKAAGRCVLGTRSLSSLAALKSETPAETCAALNGALNAAQLSFRAGRYDSQAQCEAGRCEGSINAWRKNEASGRWTGEQPWSAEQCLRLSDKQCDQWCPKCRTDASALGSGACFADADLSVERETSAEECAAKDNHTWFACPSAPAWTQNWDALTTLCSAQGSLPSQVASTLGCRAEFSRCETAEACEARGQCVGTYGNLDFETYRCTDQSWTHGDTFWAEQETTQGSGADATTVSEWVECPQASRSVVQGVCIGERDAYEGCGAGKWHLWHQLGCKVEGIYAEADCTGERTWHAPIRRAEDCDVQGCRLNRWDVRAFDSAECASCGGEAMNMARWRGGNFMEAFTRPYVWHAQGRRMEPVNQWVPRQMTFLVERELARPSMKAFAQYKKQELLATYNAYSKVLETVACDCAGAGSSAGAATCFESQTQGVLAAQQVLPEGQTTEAGAGVFVVTGGAATEAPARRFLAEAGEQTRVSVTEYSAGVFAKHAPCAGSDASTLDAFAVLNAGGRVVGQLIGDGRGVNVSGSVQSVLVCLSARDDLTQREDLFSVLAVGERDADGVVRPLMFANDSEAYVERTASQVCVEVAGSGVFFPIRRVPDARVEATTACASACAHGTCVLDSAGAAQCVCLCGFSGAACESGCASSCNGRGSCDAASNACTCEQGSSAPLYTGAACGKMNCPADSDGNACSGNGLCSVASGDARCNCTLGWTGADCGTEEVGDTSGADSGFGNASAPISRGSGGFTVGAPTRQPTPASGGGTPTVAGGSPTAGPPTTDQTSPPVLSAAPLATRVSLACALLALLASLLL